MNKASTERPERPADDVLVGIDLGGTKIAGLAATLEGVEIARKTIPTEGQRSPDEILERIADLIALLLGDRPAAAVGIGVPGLVDRARGETLFLPNLHTQWRNVPVRARLAARFSCHVEVLNDARVATLAEREFGKGQGVDDMLFCAVGTGIGGGLVLDGHLRLGSLGAAGEIGHQTVSPDGPPCGCGSRGCLETLSAGPALTAEGVRLLQSGQAKILNRIVAGDLGRVNAGTMTEAARAGDESVRAVLDRAFEFLGIGVANVITIVHPHLVVFGGGVAHACGDLMVEGVRRTVLRRVKMQPFDSLRFEVSELGSDAGVWGAVALARRSLVASGL
jgi:glucokinase